MRVLPVVLLATVALAGEPMPPSAAPAFTPVVVGQIRYEQDLSWPGYLFARAAKSGELLFITQVAPQRLVAGREEGGVRFTSMTHDAKAETLTIVDEARRTHVVSVKEKERGSHWPVRVELVKAAPFTVRLTIPNLGPKPLALDEPTVCKGGEVSNRVFRVSVDGKELEYRGMMAKRGRPDSFIMVKPGRAYQVDVDLSDAYEVPAAGTVTVRFEAFNHFSKDELSFVSNELVVQR
ncbi:MAG: hypothetical protein JNJ54_31285 [Myxococcaceae bacterium]|nr:hypothetical protein [Myxococcaceae bacterium]